MRELLIVWLTLLAAQQPPAPAPTPAQPPPGTDIYEISFSGSADDLQKATPRPLARERGYENQPYYTPDGAAILFTAARDGKPTDIYQVDRASGRVSQVTSTPEGEYSPNVTPDGRGISVIRVEPDGTQRLWRFDRKGANPQVVLADIKPVGYHAWLDEDQLALFVLGKPATLHHARASTGKSEVVARDIGRSIHRMPGGKAASFSGRHSDGELWVLRFDPATRAVTTLVRVPDGSVSRDMAWLADGTLLMSAGTKVLAWKSGDKGWREVLDVAAHKLGAVTRMAVSPDGKNLALVVNEPQ